MEAVAYSTFRANLKSYMRKTYDDAETLLVTNSNAEDNVVVMSVRDYESLMETVRIYANPALFEKIARGDEQFAAGAAKTHELVEDD